MKARPVQRVLVVEAQKTLLRRLTRALEERFPRVVGVPTVGEAIALADPFAPDLVVVDFSLPDGDGREVLQVYSERSPTPATVVISSVATPEESFELAKRGVGAWLEIPFTLEQLNATVDRALRQLPALAPVLRQSVGLRGLRDVEFEVRQVMTQEALGRARGSRRGAARLLEMSRQLLQHRLKRLR